MLLIAIPVVFDAYIQNQIGFHVKHMNGTKRFMLSVTS